MVQTGSLKECSVSVAEVEESRDCIIYLNILSGKGEFLNALNIL
jgi:hypothetical protein